MRKSVKMFVLTASLLLCHCMAWAQADTLSLDGQLKKGLDDLALRSKAYLQTVDVSVTDFSIAELVKSMAISNGLSIDIVIDRKKTITCNMQKVPVKDFLYFICTEKSLQAQIIGDIVTITDYVPPTEPPHVSVDYDGEDGTVSFDFSECRLDTMARRFTKATGHNMIFPNSMSARPVSSFGTSMSVVEAVQAIAASNDLTARREGEMAWSLFEAGKDRTEISRGLFRTDLVQVDSSGYISAHLHNASLKDIVPELFAKTGQNYFLAGRIEHRVNVDVGPMRLPDFLGILFTGTPVTWREADGVYIIGDAKGQGAMSSVSVYPMKYRTVEMVPEIIPSELRQDMEIKTFPDLNSIVISGDRRNIGRIECFLDEIDRSVPMISIDVIIVDATGTSTQSMGLGLGVGAEKWQTGGTFGPGIDFKLNADSINRILRSFNGFGSIVLGKVSQFFYADLQLLEETGRIVLRSTPRLATLNGHKAVLKSGEVKYYKESQVNIIGTQNPLQSESWLWKNVEANFVLDMTPQVSADSTITLSISLSQDEFKETDGDDRYAPPGIIKRSFNSTVKVKDGEMVLLGGIEKNLKDNNSKGLPYVSRVPVLRSVFGKTRKTRTDSKLNIFIRPTIIM
ncbi:MAG: type II and III secretion system protein [Bacteroidales bacterium]|nr:type II and III secretion system protein [Bacteroidales bacterium]